MAKYELSSAEERYQPGSDNLVLANKLNIVDPAEMDALESGLLLMLYEQMFIEGQLPAILTFDHVCAWHRKWLGNTTPGPGDSVTPIWRKRGFGLLRLAGYRCLLQGSRHAFSPGLLN